MKKLLTSLPARLLIGIILGILLGLVIPEGEIGRASCRERV